MKRRTRCSPIAYSAAEMEWLEANHKMPLPDYHAAFCAEFGRTDVAAANLHGLRKRKGWKTGRTGCFEKGHVPWTAGRKLPFNANSAKTQFKRGQLPHNHVGAGHERIDPKDGYIIMIVDEENPWTGAATRPVHKHKYLWEQLHGPVPEGHALKCLDGDKLNTDPANWKPVPRALLPRLNGRFGRGYDAAPAELKPTIMAVAELEHAIRERKS